MSILGSRRFQTSVYEALASQNRAAGSGGGSGMQPMASLGLFAGNTLGAYSTANSTTWTDITGTSFTIVISRTSLFLYLFSATCRITAGAGGGFIRGNFVNFDTTSSPKYVLATSITQTSWYYPVSNGPIQPGTYTVKLQAATDAGTTITVDSGFHQFFLLGAA